jgi:hypothetical protein
VQDVGAVLFVDVLYKAEAEAALLFEAQFYREVVAAFERGLVVDFDAG